MKNSSDIFGEYASIYDFIYQDKDYATEASFVSGLIKKHCPKHGSARVLDLACGTGRHAQELARMGYSVEGSDLSADMVMVARNRAEALGLTIPFYNESFQSCDGIGRKFDVVIAMFSAINYLTDYRDLERSLANIHGLLQEGGVFIFDFWNGNAVLKSYSPVRVRRVERGEHTVIRITNTTLDTISQIATLNFDFMLLERGRIVQEFSEVHPIRYFFPQEMVDLLAANAFEVVHRCPFLKENSAMEPDEWNLTYAVRPCK